MPESGCKELGDGTYELGSDIEGGFTINGSVSLDLKGYTVSNSANQGVFSLINSSKKLFLSNGTVIQNNTANAAFRVDNNSSVELTDVAATSNDHFCIDIESGSARIYSGTYTVKNSTEAHSLIRVNSNNSLIIYGGIFTTEGTTPGNLIDLSRFARTSIGGGTFSIFPTNVSLGDTYAMLKTDEGFKVIESSKLKEQGALWKVSSIPNANTDVYFLTTADKDEFLNEHAGSKAEPYNGYTVSVSTNIEGKSVKFEVARGENISEEELKSKLGLDKDKRYSLEGVVDSDGNTYDFNTPVNSDLALTAKLKHVVAYIGDTGYETLQAAIGAVNNNETIELCDDVTEDVYVNNGKTFTIDLAGKTLTAKSDNSSALEITKSSKVTVKNGTISASSNAIYVKGDMYSVSSNVLNLDGVTAASSSDATVRAEYATVAVDGGSYASKSSSSDIANSTAFYIYGSTATINGGTFTGSDEDKNAVALYYHGTLTVNGGTFINQINVDSGALTVNAGTFGTYANLAAVADGKAMLKHKSKGYEVLDTAAAMAAARCVVVDFSDKNIYFEDADEAAAYAKEISGETTTVCHVSFDSDGGTEVETQDILAGGVATEPSPAPTKEGYTFAGWTLDGQPYTFGTKLTSDIELKAQWNINTYTVTFLNDDGSTFSEQKVEYNKTASAPENKPAKEGYAFVAWQLDGQDYDFKTPVTGNIALAPSWNQIFTVSFVDEDGSVLAESQQVENGKYATAAEPTFTKEGYDFATWTLNGEKFDFKKTPIASDTTLVASWTIKTYTVTFDTDGGSKVESQKVNHGEYASTPESAPTKTGYEFAGWQLDGVSFDFEKTPITGDITLKATWTEKEYTVNFDTDGGSPAPKEQKVKYGKLASEPEVPTKNGQGFAGWFVVGEDGSISDDDEDHFYFEDEEITEDITLKAKWSTPVAESNGKQFASLYYAAEWAPSGSTIKLIADDKNADAGAYIEDKDLTIDLNNYSLAGEETTSIIVFGESNIVVKNGDINCPTGYSVGAQGATSESDDATARVTLQNVNISKTGNNDSLPTILSSYSSEITINSGNYSSGSSCAVACLGGKVIVNSGTFSSEADSNKYAALVYKGVLEINGGTFNDSVYVPGENGGSNQATALAAEVESSEASVAELASSDSSSGDDTDSDDESTKLVINGGKFGAADNYKYLASGKAFLKAATSGDTKGYYEVVNTGNAKKEAVAKVSLDGSDIYFENADEAATFAGEHEGATLKKYVTAKITEPENLVYNGTAKEATVVLTGIAETDKDKVSAVLEYEYPDGTKTSEAPVNIGKYTAKVAKLTGDEEGKYELRSEVSCNFEITATPTPAVADISKAKVTLSKTAFTYNGKAQKPSVKSVVLNGKTLKSGTDYTASIASGKKVGTYKVTINAKGSSYSGKATASFVVNPKGVAKFKVSKAKKAFKAKWTKNKTERSGVQIRYSTKKSMAGAKTVKAKGTSVKAKTVKKLKKKTKYYVQARSYKVVNGKTYYSSWSAKKAVKTK